MNSVIEMLGTIGESPEEGPEQRLRRRLIVYMGLLMSVGGLVWGTLSLSLGSVLPAVVPYGYVVLTLCNLSYLYRSRDFRVARWFQVLISLLLPFVFQWSLGGFAATGGVMLLAVLALVGTYSYGSWKHSAIWSAAFVGLTIFSGVIDSEVGARFTRVEDEGARTAFFVVNIAMTSTIMLSLAIWLMARAEQLRYRLQSTTDALGRLNESLEETIRRRTEKLEASAAELGQANSRLRPLAKAWEEVWEPIEICDANGLVTFMNPALAESSTQKVGQVSQALLIDRQLLSRLRLGQSGTATRSAVDEGSGKGREFQLTFSPVPDETGELSRIIILHRDITERLERERELMHKDRLTSLGTLAAGMAHEINNPLMYMQANLEEVRDALSPTSNDSALDEETLRQLADECLFGVRRIAQIVDTLRGVARPRESQERVFVLGAVVDSCLRAVGHEIPLKAQLKVVIPEEPLYVEGNEGSLSHVLINLLLNALGAMVSAERELNLLTVQLSRESEHAFLDVSDTGSGIPEDDLSMIFDPFYTTKPVGEGMGLGLAISHQLVIGMRGSIVPTSVLGEGTTFRVTLPVAEGPQADEAVSLEPEPEPIRAARILIIDDLPAVTKVLSRTLRHHHVTTAHSASEALKQLEDDDFDVILCDIMMPVMTGVELRTVVTATRPRLAARFVFVTGGIFSATEEKIAEESGCLILRKPVGRKELFAAVAEVIESTQGKE